VLKRSFDLLLVGITSPIWLLLLGVVAAIVRVKLGSPIFYRQLRPGKNGVPFQVIKFRTMDETRDALGQLLPDSIRLRPFGRRLRETSLDELPQLLNVVRGDMSLIGPRPLLMEYLDRYTARQARRHEVRPGMTGLAQVMGRNSLSWEEKFDWDVRYVETISFRLDLKILYFTLRSVISRKGINAEGVATMPKFESMSGRSNSS